VLIYNFSTLHTDQTVPIEINNETFQLFILAIFTKVLKKPNSFLHSKNLFSWFLITFKPLFNTTKYFYQSVPTENLAAY